MDALKNIMKLFNFKSRSPYVVGVEFGRTTVKVTGVNIAGARSVDFCAVADLPEGKDDDAAIRALQAALKGKTLPSNTACLNFSDDSLAIRRMTIQAAKNQQIADTLVWQAADKVHFDMDTATIGFKLVGTSRGKAGAESVDVLFAATPRELIEKRLKTMKAAGLSPEVVSIVPSGIETMIRLDEEVPASGTVMVVDFGCSRTDISFYKNKGLDFVRTIATGSGDITEAIARGINVAAPEAEKIKDTLGIAYDPVTLESGIESIRVLAAMRPVIETLSKEIKRSTEYYAREFGGATASALYLAGGGARLKNLDRYLGEELGLTVKKIRIPKGIDVSRAGMKGGEELSFISLIGTAIGHETQVDLLPKEVRAEKAAVAGKVLAIAGAAVIAVVLAVIFIVMSVSAGRHEAKLKKAGAEMASMEPVKDLLDRVAEKETLLAQSRKSELPMGYVMREISNFVPTTVAFTSLRINSKGKTLDISGYVNDKFDRAQKTLLEFMELLEKSKYIKDAQMTSLQGAGGGAEKTARANFSIACVLE